MTQLKVVFPDEHKVVYLGRYGITTDARRVSAHHQSIHVYMYTNIPILYTFPRVGPGTTGTLGPVACRGGGGAGGGGTPAQLVGPNCKKKSRPI